MDVDNGVVVCGGEQAVLGVSVADGAVLWRIETPGATPCAPPCNPPAIADGVAYVNLGKCGVGPQINWLLAISTKTGQILWRRDLHSPSEGVAVANGYVYVSAPGSQGLMALDALTGALVWHADFGGAMQPIVAYGGVYVGAGNRIYRFAPEPPDR
jgi:outer membrane protein assembly factor BamB